MVFVWIHDSLRAAMSDGGRQQKPDMPAEAHEGAHEEPAHKGHSVEANRAWAQNRIASFFRGQRVMRKADGDSAAHADEGHDAKVSQPGEPAEHEADAVADHVAEQLHSGGDKPGARQAAEPKQSAPSIGAKLQPGAISLAGKNGGGGQAPAWKNVAVSSSRRTHILVGDATGGGHSHKRRFRGKRSSRLAGPTTRSLRRSKRSPTRRQIIRTASFRSPKDQRAATSPKRPSTALRSRSSSNLWAKASSQGIPNERKSDV